MFYIGTIRKLLRDRSRHIFRFWDGTRHRYTDPVVIGSRLEEIIPDYSELMRTLARPIREDVFGSTRDEMILKQKEAGKKLYSASRAVFGLSVMNEAGDGLTEAEALNVLAQYLLFMQQLARDSQLFQNSQRVA